MSGTINPIIPGFSPDPSVVKVGDWFYLINSSFHFFPGLPIYASKDLVSWEQIGNAINRQSQLSLARSDANQVSVDKGKIMIASGGLYAPTIRYHQGTFYVVCTNVIHVPGEAKDRTENFIVSSDNIWSDIWSDPVYFEFDGIDPSIFFEDGKTYIQGSAAPGPYTTINLFEVDLKTGAKLSEEKVIWRGTGDIYPEGPHLYKCNDWYYLLIAEGGTHDGHMVTTARSRHVWGPYESCPNNPVLSARGTTEYVQYTGHCEIFQDEKKQWWGTCIGARVDDQGRNTMGRETFLTKVAWDNEWFTFEQVKLNPGLPAAPSSSHLTAKPGVDNLYIRDAVLSNYRLAETSITLTASSVDLSHPELSPTFIGRRQRQLNGTSSVVVQGIEESWGSAKIMAGLACYKEEHRYLRIYYDAAKLEVVFELINTAKKIARTEKHVLVKAPSSVAFRIDYTEKEYRLLYSVESNTGQDWACLGTVDTLDVTNLDFTGPVIGIYALGQTEDVQVPFESLRVD
ncbi:Concanavalin A-like lectin/glucanase subgroup [Penicillium cf. griseofulvum]|uniref:Concanavalin A-like lectin/glucanase subgroup n=1 Tax=Penicillium cf. griseofulvum TaxID=2972120 RepID=A0A9W9JPI8_9EURO|nr:Concanavalin A-like lectin/glucanase subgroup [Penicillium cf. griseofulvum]KAJ5423339.1 Concanavalin A-like lectin/glucanase subgroup [Penicillium cf. griseofulvum]